MNLPHMISVDAALSLLKEHQPDWGVDITSLDESVGRVLAEDITADYNLPAYSVSVMDGYACNQTDLDDTLTIIGESRAGEPFTGELNSGQAVRIFTGAILPAGADVVEIQEHAARQGNQVRFTERSVGRTYIRAAGSDFKAGDKLLMAGHKIMPANILTLASANRAAFKTYKLPTVAIIRAGDELVPVGGKIKTGEIIDSNGPGLKALLTSWGVKVIDLGLAPDNPDDIVARFKDCEADIIIPIGGASVGDYDFMKQAFISQGFDIQFSKIAIKPGKPTWLARCGEQRVLGLPGNPSSAWVCAHIFLKTLLGLNVVHSAYKTGAHLYKNGNRETFLRAKFNEAGEVVPLGIQDSGLVMPLSSAEVLIRRKIKANPVPAGELVDCVKL